MTRLQKLYGTARLASRLAMAAAVRRRKTLDLTQRLSDFPRQLPLHSRVRISWNDQQVPFVEADHDEDLAVALGAVHAHLRLAQMEIMRRIAYGRLSEAVGMIALELDQTLRLLDLPRAVPETLERLPAPTRTWLDGFVAGVNATIGAAAARPEEFAILGLRAKPWSVTDVLVLGQLAAIDFSWRVWHRLVSLRERPDWTDLWKRIVETDIAPVPSLAGSAGAPQMTELLWGAFGRTGSNAAAVSAARSATGGALLTSDPHLSIIAPNSWLAAGMASPGYNIVGLMIPGLPVIALGRNRSIAWSGTSLHAASSDLFDVTDVPADSIRIRSETIRVRWGRPHEQRVRETDHGPIISDSPLLGVPGQRDLALTWIGHRPSDELSAMLAMMRAQNWHEFTAAIDDFAAPAQNLIFADTTGKVGQAMAAHLPRRPLDPPADLVMPPDAVQHWRAIVTANGLPRSYDPEQGFVASANDRPIAQTSIPVGFFFSPNERVSRLRSVLDANTNVTLADLGTLHRDVAMPSSSAIRDLLLSTLDEAAHEPEPAAADLIDALRNWDGLHDADSNGALAFELFLYHFLHVLHGEQGMALYRGSLQPWQLLREDMIAIPREQLCQAARGAIAGAAKTYSEHRSWGDIHRIRLSHPFAPLPLLGRRYVFSDVAVGGSNETLMKTSHGLSSGPHNVGFGANARFLADMSDPDNNYVVLLGGQDGWLGSTTFADQFALWQQGAYMRLPLQSETARAEFAHATTVTPAAQRGQNDV